MNLITKFKNWWSGKKDFETSKILVPKEAGKWDYVRRFLEFDKKCELVLKTGGISPKFYFDARHWYSLGIHGKESESRLREIREKQLGILFEMTDSLSKGSSES